MPLWQPEIWNNEWIWNLWNQEEHKRKRISCGSIPETADVKLPGQEWAYPLGWCEAGESRSSWYHHHPPPVKMWDSREIFATISELCIREIDCFAGVQCCGSVTSWYGQGPRIRTTVLRIRILLFSSVAFKRSTKIIFFAFLLFEGRHLHHSSKIKRQ